MANRLLSKMQRMLMPSPVKARHIEYSMLYSEDDAVSRPSPRLIDLAVETIRQTQLIPDLEDISKRTDGRLTYGRKRLSLWPGEHYKLLAGLVKVLRPLRVVEIGTAEGLSALTLLKYLPEEGSVLTFDVVRWNRYPNSCLQQSDFDSGKLVQLVADLGDADTFQAYRDTLIKADLVFIDAAKDGFLERRLIGHFEKLNYESDPIFVFDDIRLWNMLHVWRDLSWPKLDLTSFGHWCGTGIAEAPSIKPRGHWC
ncbi:MAG TPA: hypothetical protein VJ023_16010 [Pyrinomonadaceae bacterium]|nr:hypothetical protein [Pyrinomonadaceae bacterium]